MEQGFKTHAVVIRTEIWKLEPQLKKGQSREVVAVVDPRLWLGARHP